MADPDTGNEGIYEARPESEVERLTHGICDALKFLPPSGNAGVAILRGLLKGTPHEGHDWWSNSASADQGLNADV